jgi:hypothetical protein
MMMWAIFCHRTIFLDDPLQKEEKGNLAFPILLIKAHGASMKELRKLLAITLLAVIALPLISSLFAQSAKGEGSLPACCRRQGKHHCMAGRAGGLATSNAVPRFRSPLEKCPDYPGLTIVSDLSIFALPANDAIYAGLVSHPAVVAQTQCKWRVARERARQKRGPPSFLL